MDAKKIIVVGDVLGQFSTFFKKMKNLKETKNFDLVLCAGSFFSYGDEDSEDANLVYIAKEYNVGMPVYVLGPIFKSQRRFYKRLFTQDLLEPPTFEDGYDIAVNVMYMGKKGIFTTADGLRIAYLSGIESDTLTDFTFTLTDVDDMINRSSAAGRIDVLLTTNYPYQVNQQSRGGQSDYLKQLNDNGSKLVAKLAKHILPRYHFSSSAEEKWEREPYRNHLILNEQPKLVTRFISIEKVRENEPAKWTYAFKLIPATKMDRKELIKQPDDATDNPYLKIDFNTLATVKKESIISENGSYFFQTSSLRNDQTQNKRSNGVNRNQHNVNDRNQASSSNRSYNSNDEPVEKRSRPNDPCWFCLSNPQADKELVLDLADHVYLALAKGGIVAYHFLIIPIHHRRSIAELELSADDSVILNEIGQYKNALVDFFDSKKLVPVFFERNYKSNHLQLQVVGIPKEKAEILVEVLCNECYRRRLKVNEIKQGQNISKCLNGSVPYFYMEILGKRFFIGIRVSLGFSMQFGRELLAREEILNCPDRINWRDCELDPKYLEQLKIDIRKEYEPFKFSE